MIKTLRFLGSAISIAILSISHGASAWGPVGHYAVGTVAESYLTPTAKNAVQDLLGNESLGDAANWADVIKSQDQYQQAHWYHFEKIPNGVSFLDNLKQMPPRQKSKGGMVAAILYARETMVNKSAPKADQIAALKFVVHLIGDIHQPLHSGAPEDKGGVTLDVDWFGRPMNLHRIWDSGMMMTGHSNIMSYNLPIATSGRSFARYLQGAFSTGSVSTEMDVEKWLNESMALRPGAYDESYKTDQTRYQNVHLKELDQRVFAAGIRLAALLNDAFGGKAAPPSEVKLWKDIENASGAKMDKLISFAP